MYMYGIVRIICLISFVFFVSTYVCHAAMGRVVEVREGDLLMVLTGGQTQKIRLYGVICPVKGQPFHEEARMLANFLTLQKNVEIIPVFRDAEATYALLRIDGTKYFLNERLMGYGMAWVRPTECKATLCNEWRKLEERARENEIGLWAAPAPVPPWEWDREKRMDIYRRGRQAPKGQD